QREIGASMNQQLRDLRTRLDALEGHFDALALQLDRAAQALRDPGSPPPDGLGILLTAAQHDFAELCDCALRFGESLGVAPTDETGSLDSLVRLRAFVALIDATEQ